VISITVIDTPSFRIRGMSANAPWSRIATLMNPPFNAVNLAGCRFTLNRSKPAFPIWLPKIGHILHPFAAFLPECSGQNVLVTNVLVTVLVTGVIAHDAAMAA